ncbi:EEF1A lysine methyltransferase 1 isoform X2 [Synchiropus splendidus]|uniref:EEF1A lysine methyltransferase 1 isoform X2 n=1 Tax=Synchiropus splendidus TaxID=270530 RepID=UPI00237E6DFF|nr:EEF1A lysine methyltransferase 1 isoform X2 [Synchiropus splendidus]
MTSPDSRRTPWPLCSSSTVRAAEVQSSSSSPRTHSLWELLRRTGIACVSAPSVYQKLKQEVVSGSDSVSAVVLEYDRRFSCYGQDFVFYDYNEPLNLPTSVTPRSFDIVLADPPYLSQECLTKVAQTVKYLSKGKVLLCTGAIMENLAKELLDLKMCSFLPQHSRNLSNEFRCFVNYPSRLLSC